VPDLALQYGEGTENPNAMRIFPDGRIVPDQVFNKYIQAIGGAVRLNALTSFVATGTTEGFNTNNAKVPVEIYARAPNQLTQVIKTFEGDAVKTYDGRNAWAAEGWRQLPLMTFTGGNLANAKLEAIALFPAGIQKAFSKWEGSIAVIGDNEVQVLQGTNPGELPVNFYFDESGLLVRMLRWNRTTVGTVPTETDYSDYRDVAGVKMPFKSVVTWTNGRNTIELSKVQPNVAIPAARFARPAPFKAR
jgi:zinc protease